MINVWVSFIQPFLPLEVDEVIGLALDMLTSVKVNTVVISC